MDYPCQNSQYFRILLGFIRSISRKLPFLRVWHTHAFHQEDWFHGLFYSLYLIHTPPCPMLCMERHSLPTSTRFLLHVRYHLFRHRLLIISASTHPRENKRFYRLYRAQHISNTSVFTDVYHSYQVHGFSL